MSRHGVGIAALVAAVTAACEAVPEIRFVDTDASIDTADAAPAADGGVSEVDGGSSDGSLLCSSPPPTDEGAVCCGSVWCIGNCEARNCDACATAGCAPAEVCCGRPNNVQCKSKCP